MASRRAASQCPARNFLNSSRKRIETRSSHRPSQPLSRSTARPAIAAGVRLGWDRYAGPTGDVICLDRFGASAPGEVALKNLGFNVENVVTRARGLL